METETKEITITQAHLDSALAQPWDTVTCVLAQALTEHFGPLMCCSGDSAVTTDRQKNIIIHDKTVLRIVHCFDRIHGSASCSHIMEEIKSLLPHTFTAKIKKDE